MIRSKKLLQGFTCFLVLITGSLNSLAQESVDPALFDINVSVPAAKPGEYVLCPSRQFYESALTKGIEKSTFVYYAATLVKAGNKSSEVKNLAGRRFSIPNELIIPIPAGQKANVGDIVLTWWQSGSGMQRAIVVGGSESKPIVRFLDVKLDNPSGVGQKEHSLKPDSFYVLNQEFQIGTTVRIRTDRPNVEKLGIVVASNENKIIVREFAGKLNAYPRKMAQPIPASPELKSQQEVQAAIYGTFKPMIVKRVDPKIGRVFVSFQLGRKEREMAIPFGNIYAE